MSHQTKTRIPQAVAILALLATAHAWAKLPLSRNPQKTREDYIARIQQQTTAPPSDAPLGSLWVSGGALTSLQTDYKASRLNDLVTIVVVQNTTATATGNTTTQRDFNAQSGISGLAGRINTGGVSDLLTASSTSKLKGAGSTDASSVMKTNLAGQVIAVLPNGNMVVEAERAVTINSQKETMVVRGVLRPGDVGPDNTALSTALSHLEIELKGKGVVSDANRPPNRLVRALLWFLNF
jgi:flagellar L-ring protein precursor FlgH